MGNVIDSILAFLQGDSRWLQIAEGHLSPPMFENGDGQSSLLFAREDVLDIVAATVRAASVASIRRDLRDGLVRLPPTFESSGERHLFNHYLRLVRSDGDDRDRARGLAALFAVSIERHSLEPSVNQRVRALVTLATSVLGPIGDDRPYLTHTVRRTTGVDMDGLAARAPRSDLDSLTPRQIFNALAEMDARDRKALATKVAEWLASEIVDLADFYPFNKEGVRFRPVFAPTHDLSGLAVDKEALEVQARRPAVRRV